MRFMQWVSQTRPTRDQFQFASRVLIGVLGHAAVHETRKDFTATKWVRTPSPSGFKQYPQVLKQVWFSGSHSDVGGGYPDHDLSDITLIWMVVSVFFLFIAIVIAFVISYLQSTP
jgi:hypothetical protein